MSTVNYKELRTNTIHKTKNYGNLIVLEYKDYFNCVVKFIDTGYITKARWDCIASGNVKDKLFPSVYGIGYLGYNHPVPATSIYKRWSAMISRCYNPLDEAYKNYGAKGITVCSRWLNLSLYWEDLQKMENYDKLVDNPSSWDVDKDKLGETIYCIENCLIIPNTENISIAHKDKSKGRILQYSLDGKLLGDYKSQAEASKITGIDKGSISSCCNNKRTSAGGFIWKKYEI